MNKVNRTQRGNRCITAILADKPRTITRLDVWDIRPENSSQKNLCMTIGKYKKPYDFTVKALELENPKSQVSLDREEFQKLLEFLQTNYDPFRRGFDSFIPLNRKFDQATIDALMEIVKSPAKKDLLDFIVNNEILADELMSALQTRTRIKAVEEFECMLSKDLDEHAWQKWFMRNDWVLGSEFVRVLDERAIDTANITDYLMQAYDGFLDVVEIKRPKGTSQFWARKVDHGNYVQSHQLTEAITQSNTYLTELEREANSVKFFGKSRNQSHKTSLYADIRPLSRLERPPEGSIPYLEFEL